MISNAVTFLVMMMRAKVSLRVKRGNLNKWNGLKVSFRAVGGQKKKKKEFFIKDFNTRRAKKKK